MTILKVTLIHFIFYLIFCTLQSSDLYAQLYNFQNYSVDNGFPQANADHIIQDHYGYIWIATQVGAVRFDGEDYHIFNSNNGLSSHIVTSFLESNDNNIWIATRNGLSVYNYDTISSFFIADGLPDNDIKHIWEDLNNRLWVMTAKGLCYKESNKFISIKLPVGYTTINEHVLINDTIYLTTDNGILQQNQQNFTPVFRNFDGLNIQGFAIDNTGALWVSAKDKGLFKFHLGELTLWNESSILKTNAIGEIFKDRNGFIWIGTEGNGVFKIENNHFIHMGSENGMTNTSVLDIFEDSEGNIWIGGRNGIMVFDPTNPFIHYPQANRKTQESVFGMLNDSKGNYWFSTYGNGISKFNGKQWQYFDKTNGLPDDRIFSMIENPDGTFWLSTAGKGIVYFDGEKFSRPPKTPNARTFSILKDNQNNLWMCTQSDGLIKYNGLDFQYYNKQNGLSGNAYMCGLKDSKGILWFGSIGSGAIKFDGKSFINTKLNLNKPPEYIRAIVEDEYGNIWFGTASQGVHKLIPKKDNTYDCFTINTQKGLKSDNVYFLIFDKQNTLWVGTEKGVDRIVFNNEHDVQKVVHYGKEEGFIGVETSINGAMADKNGNLWFGSNIGATLYNEKIENSNTTAPKTYITGLQLFYENTNWTKYTDKIDIHGLPINLTLEHKNNHLLFKYVGLSFTNPKKVQYRHMLEGLDLEWSPPRHNKEAIYTNIPPGTYTFKVISCNNDNIWNKTPTSFTFTIKPPFWRTIWFYFVVVAFISMIILIYIRTKTQSLKRTSKMLAQMVDERTHEIEIQKDEIQEKNEELNQRTEEIATQRDELDNQNKMLEHLYKDQTNSIKHARYIQTAVMPKTDFLNKAISDHFILHKPQSIVSGDFYFAANHLNHTIIAAIDSTGHGVPGGFMSMLGISFLNEIVYTMPDIKVDIILNKLRDKVIHSLKQKGIPGEQKEGMELSIIAIDNKTKTCQFAGAKNEVTLIRTNNETPKNAEFVSKKDNLHQFRFKPDKMPVSIYPIMNPFTINTFQLYPDDQLYLYTDGYADQTNATFNKKITHKKLRELLLHNAQGTMQHQKTELETFLTNWQKESEQIDDILIIGIKI